MTRRSFDDLETLERRLASWKAEVGTQSEYAAFAPRIIADLETEIAERKRANR